MFTVDTNVLVYAANQSCPEHARCRHLVQEWRHQSGAWYVTWKVLYEFLRIVTHPRVLTRPFTTQQGMAFVTAILASRSVGVLRETDRHLQVVQEIVDGTPLLSGNLFHDLHTAALMREHGIARIYTRDTDFHKFGFLDVLDPLQV